MAYIRSAGLRGVRQVLTELGGDPDDLARRCGLPTGALDSDEILVEDLGIALLLETAAAELDCPDLGLRVAGLQDLDMLGPVAVAVKNARSTTQALEMTSKYLFFHSRSIEITVVGDPRGHDDAPTWRCCRHPGRPSRTSRAGRRSSPGATTTCSECDSDTGTRAR